MSVFHGVTVRVEACAKTFADGTRALEPITLDVARGETLVLPRSLRMRQDHHAADHRRPRTAGRRRPRAVQWRGRDRHPDRTAQCRHGVSILRAVSQHDRRGKYRLWPEDPRRQPDRPRGARRRTGCADRNRGPGAAPHRPAVGRPTPARRAGTRGRGTAKRAAARRAADRARRGIARKAALASSIACCACWALPRST